MNKQDYNQIITLHVKPNEAFKGICKVSEWWGKNNIEGETENLNDVFTYHIGDTRVTFKIIEFIPDKKIVWLCTDGYLPWLEDKTEWKNTKIVFEISENENSTQINFMHIGLVPEVECYEMCVKGWDRYFKDSLLKFLTTGKSGND